MTCKTLPVTHTCACGRRIRGNSFFAHQRVCGKGRTVYAYQTMIDGITDGYIAAETPGKARYIALCSLKEAGYSESAQFKNIHIVRRPEYDEWAKTANSRVYSHEYMPAPKEVAR